jgi:hypothetical protein
MSETLSRGTLNQSDKKLLEEALSKSPAELKKNEVAVIRARRSYLTAIEREAFKRVLEEKEEKKNKDGDDKKKDDKKKK